MWLLLDAKFVEFEFDMYIYSVCKLSGDLNSFNFDGLLFVLIRVNCTTLTVPRCLVCLKVRNRAMRAIWMWINLRMLKVCKMNWNGFMSEMVLNETLSNLFGN